MKLNFTQIGTFCFLLLGFISLQAQNSNNLEITSPPEIAGNYTAIQPPWGLVVANFEGTGTFTDDGEASNTNGCEAGATNILDKIAFIDRGDCEFGLKAFTAEADGAIGVVICNDVPLDPPAGLAAGEDGDNVTIPVWSMSYDDCQIIRQFAEGGDVECSFGYRCGTPSYPANIIWGRNPGEGDFEGGLNDWTIETWENNGMSAAGQDTSWRWTDDPVTPGSFSGNFVMTSTTACNGYMAFPSDWLDNRGNFGPGNGTGDCPSYGVGGLCRGSLFSPTIELDDPDAIDGLFVQFTQGYRYFISTATNIIASYDGGTTWPDTINPALFAVVNAGAETERINAPLRLYNGEPTVNLQFYHQGNYYFYNMDDVTLLSGGYLDINVVRDFMGVSPVWNMPLSQAQDIPFHVDIWNAGNLAADGVQIQGEVFHADDPSTPVWTYINEGYATQPAYDPLNENNSFRETYTPDRAGLHTGLYTNITPNDGIASNDTLSFSWMVNDEDKWITVPESATINNDGSRGTLFDGVIFDDPTNNSFIQYDYAVAYSFYLPNGDGMKLDKVRFGVEDLPTNSGQIDVYLYLWNPTGLSTDDTVTPTGNYAIEAGDRKLLGCLGEDMFGQRPATPTQIINPNIGVSQEDICVKMALANPATGTVNLDANGELRELELQDDQRYVLVFAIKPTAEQFVNIIAGSADANTTQLRYNTRAVNLALDTLGLDRFYGASCKTLDDGSFAFVDGLDFDGVIAGTNFGTLYDNNMMWLEMDIVPLMTSTENITPEAAASVNVFPNPVTEIIQVEVALNEASDVSLQLSDINGKLVRVSNHTNILSETLSMNVKDLTPGNYSLAVRSEAGFTTKKVMIQR